MTERPADDVANAAQSARESEVEVDLEALASEVGDPRDVPAAASGRPYGRLDDLAMWWAGVRPDGVSAPQTAVVAWAPPDAPVPVTTSCEVTRLPVTDLRTLSSVPHALALGVATADEVADRGASVLIVSVPEPRAGTLGVHIMGLTPVEAMGWPGEDGPDDAHWIARVADMRDTLRLIREIAWPTGRQVLDVVDAPALAAGTALLLRAAARRTPVLLDGPGAAVCALMARQQTRRVGEWWQLAATDTSPVQTSVIEALGLRSLTALELGHEDGTAGLLALSLLEAASGLRPLPGP